MKIAVWAESGIGGTEKAASIFASELSQRGYQVDFLTPKKGVRAEFLTANGVRVFEGKSTNPAIEDYIRHEKPDVIHQHVPGYPLPNPIYDALKRLDGRRPSLIETNVFGRFEDPASEGVVQHRLFVSRSSATQAFRRADRKMDVESLRQCTVVNNPLIAIPPHDLAVRREMREELGLSDGDVLAVRIGQPGRGKWTHWEARAYRLALRKIPNLRLLLMEPPICMQEKLRRSSPGLMIMPATADFDRIRRIYAAADLMIHASYFGESFGYTIAEAMQAGLPVITRSTPWGDNAQVEIVENGTTGCVCATVTEMARRIVDLAGNEALRFQMGNAGRNRIAQLTNPKAETDVLEAVIRLVTSGQRGTILDRRQQELIDFARDFPSREERFSETLEGRPLEWLQWKGYVRYRTARTVARRFMQRLRA